MVEVEAKDVDVTDAEGLGRVVSSRYSFRDVGCVEAEVDVEVKLLWAKL